MFCQKLFNERINFHRRNAWFNHFIYFFMTLHKHICCCLHLLNLTFTFSCNHIHSSFHQQFLRSEEHTSELQSRGHLVCRLLLEKKKHILLTTLSTSAITSAQ